MGLTKESVQMQKRTKEQIIRELRQNILHEIDHWEDINRNGCNDPFWPDGTNMNLTRNHIIYAKRQIAQICEEHNIPYPEEMFLPTPPEVSDYYMASLKQKRRVQMIGHPEKITTKRNKYDWEQLSLF